MTKVKVAPEKAPTHKNPSHATTALKKPKKSISYADTTKHDDHTEKPSDQHLQIVEEKKEGDKTIRRLSVFLQKVKSDKPKASFLKRESTKSTEFNELISYTEDGRAIVDYNKLVYNPRKKSKQEHKENCAWYLTDCIFIVFNLLSLIASAYFLGIGMQATVWDQTVKAVSRPYQANTSYVPGMSDMSNMSNTLGSSNTEDPIFKITTKAKYLPQKMGPTQIGTWLMVMGLVNSLNVILGIMGCVDGYKFVLISHALVDLVILVIHLGIAILVVQTAECEESDLYGFQEGMEFMIRSFTEVRRDDARGSDEQYYAQYLLDEMQISLACCGATNWTDYMNARVTYVDSDNSSRRGTEALKSSRVFPFSCCRPWWVRNIYCSENVHTWTYKGAPKELGKKFRERITQEGCVEKVWEACKMLVFLLGNGLLLLFFLDLFLVIFEILMIHRQIRSMDMLMREIKKEEGVKLGLVGEDSSSDEDSLPPRRDSRDFFTTIKDMLSLKRKGEPIPKKKKPKGDRKSRKPTLARGSYVHRLLEELKNAAAPPTPDEIRFIKDRTPYAEFEEKMKDTDLGKLMATVKEEETDEDSDEEPVPVKKEPPPPPPVEVKPPPKRVTVKHPPSQERPAWDTTPPHLQSRKSVKRFQSIFTPRVEPKEPEPLPLPKPQPPPKPKPKSILKVEKPHPPPPKPAVPKPPPKRIVKKPPPPPPPKPSLPKPPPPKRLVKKPAPPPPEPEEPERVVFTDTKIPHSGYTPKQRGHSMTPLMKKIMRHVHVPIKRPTPDKIVDTPPPPRRSTRRFGYRVKPKKKWPKSFVNHRSWQYFYKDPDDKGGAETTKIH